MHPQRKYEHFTNNELARLNKVIGNQAKELEDDMLFELWQEISKALSLRDLNTQNNTKVVQ